jgi:hypothetical protein
MVGCCRKVKLLLTLHMMRDTLRQRPDDAGSLLTKEGKVALGHRRLSFLELERRVVNRCKRMNQGFGSFLMRILQVSRASAATHTTKAKLS